MPLFSRALDGYFYVKRLNWSTKVALAQIVRFLRMGVNQFPKYRQKVVFRVRPLSEVFSRFALFTHSRSGTLHK